MPIPTFEKMLRPLLDLATKEDLTRSTATVAMEDHFQLTPDERSARIETGATYVRNRTGWAMTFLTKGRLIERIAPRTYRATEFGRQFLRDHPDSISVKDLRTISGWEESWHRTKTERSGAADVPVPDDTTPIEALTNAAATLNADLKNRLLAAILDRSATFFEELVLDVLVKMGYGGTRADAAEHLGKSGDEGVDGRVKQDPLGLDQILVQAKRYAPYRPIDRPTIQAFVGSMAGQGVTKGVFITTSTFTEGAKEFVRRGLHTKVVLIDGDDLLKRMFEHHIGVRVVKEIEVLDLDQNYFNEEE